MARFFLQYLAVYSNENLPNDVKKLPRSVQNLAKIQNKLSLTIAKDFNNISKRINFDQPSHIGNNSQFIIASSNLTLNVTKKGKTWISYLGSLYAQQNFTCFKYLKQGKQSKGQVGCFAHLYVHSLECLLGRPLLRAVRIPIIPLNEPA